MTNKLEELNFVDRLLNADVVCHDCGSKYGKYSVSCSSRWNGTCQVCGEEKAVTEVRDYGYLQKGIDEARAAVAKENEPDEHIILNLSEDEVAYMNEWLDVIMEAGIEEDDKPLFDSLERKITELYDDWCVKYELSPALKAYMEKYGTTGTMSAEDEARWEGFRDAFNMAKES